MECPDRALVLAAGYGSRLAPLTDRLPKPLLPFRGRPMLRLTLETLRDWGVRDALVNTHHLAPCIIRELVNHPVPGLRVTLSYEPVLLGTGGPLVRNLGFLPEDRPCWLFNADVAFEVDPTPLLRHHQRHRPLATLWMHPERGPRTVRVNERDQVTDFADPHPGSPGTHTFCGLHLLGPDVRERLIREQAPEIFSSVITAYRRWQEDGALVHGVAVPGAWWADLGTPEQVVAAHRDRAGERSTSWVAEDAQVARGARLHNAVVCSGARVGAKARITGGLVAPGTRVNGPVERLAVPARDALTEAEAVALEKQGWALDRAWADLLAPRGSDRGYLRLGDGRRRGLLMRWGTARPENLDFARHTRFLERHGVRVPKLLAGDEGKGWLLMEDLGRVDLLHRVHQASGRTRLAAYRACLPPVVRLHDGLLAAARRRRLPLQPGFTAGLYRWEHDYFITHLVQRLPGWDAGAEPALRRELQRVARRLLREPLVLVHRDLQSTNLLFHRGEAALIDYQGMRAGAAAYDLASLLADPYVDLAAGAQEQLLAAYVEAGGDPGVEAAFSAGCVQRLVQALGAYGNLGHQPATRRFLDHIPAGLRQLDRAADRFGGLPTLREVMVLAQAHSFTAPQTRAR